MKKNILLIVTGLSITLFSCKKEQADPPTDPANMEFKIKTVTGPNGLITYKYDGQGRRIEDVLYNGNKVLHEYLNGIVNEKEYDPNGGLIRVIKFELNADGLVAKETRSDDPAYIQTNSFNSDKQIIKKVINGSGGTVTADYYYTNGNPDSVRYYMNGNWSFSEKITYHAGMKNTIDFDAYGVHYFGKKSKDLLKSRKVIYPNGTNGDQLDSNYELDAKGRVTKNIATLGGNNIVVLFTY